MPFSESDGHIAMTIELKFHSPIPDGLVLYSWISVAGINHEKTAALRFAKNRNHRLELERDRSNKQDPNAIEVVGCSNGLIRKYRDVIGYLPKEVATCIVEGGYWGSIEPRLRRIYVGNDNYIDVEFQLCGPIKENKRFRRLREEVEDRKFEGQPATQLQKEFYQTFDFKAPKGLTYLAAKQFIKEKTAEIGKEDEGALQAWKYFRDILKELSDPETCEAYDIKVVSISRSRSAVVTLLDEGQSLEDISSDIQMVVDKLIELHPDLEVEY